MFWHGMFWHTLAWHGIDRYMVMRCSCYVMAWRHGMAWHGMAWHGGMAWHVIVGVVMRVVVGGVTRDGYQ